MKKAAILSLIIIGLREIQFVDSWKIVKIGFTSNPNLLKIPYRERHVSRSMLKRPITLNNWNQLAKPSNGYERRNMRLEKKRLLTEPCFSPGQHTFMAVYSRRVLPCFRTSDLKENHSVFQTDTKQLLNLAGIILHPTSVSSMSSADRPFLGSDSEQTREREQTIRDFWRNRSNEIRGVASFSSGQTSDPIPEEPRPGERDGQLLSQLKREDQVA